MGNALQQELEGRVVVLKRQAMAAPYQALGYRLFKVTGGFGAHSFTSGRHASGYHLVDGERSGIDALRMIARLATDEEIAAIGGDRGPAPDGEHLLPISAAVQRVLCEQAASLAKAKRPRKAPRDDGGTHGGADDGDA